MAKRTGEWLCYYTIVSDINPIAYLEHLLNVKIGEDEVKCKKEQKFSVVIKSIILWEIIRMSENETL